MFCRVMADILLIIHFLWVLFLILGLPIGVYYKLPRLRLLHAGGLLFALILQLSNTLCPLTIWEEYFRNYQEVGFSYRGSFLITYLEKLVYPGWISMDTITGITAVLVGATLLSFILKPLNFKS